VIWLEFALVLACIFVGSRVGGIGLGTVAAIGLAILVFVFGLPPASPPGAVLAMILAVVTAAATMEAAGGMDYLVTVAEGALRKKPGAITFVAPAVAYVFTFMAGTGHVAYAVLPVIAEVARKAGVRPERPMSIAVIASQQAITACPISAATVALLGILSGADIDLADILLICVPATFLGCMVGALSVAWRGKELADDPEYQALLKSGRLEPAVAVRRLQPAELLRARGSVLVFLGAAAGIVILGLFPDLRPSWEVAAAAGAEPGTAETAATTESLSMTHAIMILMVAAAGVNMLLFKAEADKAVRGGLMRAGIVAVVAILGIAWLGTCFFEGNRAAILGTISSTVAESPWVFAIGLFVLSILLYSQAATVVALMPAGVALGIPAPFLIAMFPAVNGYFFLPTYGTVVAAINFDRSGTTRTGSWVLNHSFMRPGLVATVASLAIGFAIAAAIHR
jgi:anaerobic C4-dicarboxylate transporter DcuA